MPHASSSRFEAVELKIRASGSVEESNMWDSGGWESTKEDPEETRTTAEKRYHQPTESKADQASEAPDMAQPSEETLELPKVS